MHLAQFINKPKRVQNNFYIIEEKNGSETGTNLASERVSQLRREIEDLDEKLMNTNTINFEEIRQSLKNNNDDRVSTQEEEEYMNTNSQIQNYELEETYIRKSQSQSYRYPNFTMKSAELQSSDLKRQQTPDYMMETQLNINHDNNTNNQNWNSRHNTQNNFMVNTSCLSGDGDVSFDYEKIIAQRNLNIKSAFENNLQDKWECIHQLQLSVQQLKKESEAKSLKMSHLKYERDSLTNQIQVEGQKKKENLKDAQGEIKKIQIKKKEDERAYTLAQGEIKRSIQDQEQVINEIIQQIQLCEQSMVELSTIMEGRRSHNSLSATSSYSDLHDKISNHSDKVQSLNNKKKDVEINIKVLKDFLRQITEEIQMTQEDLNGKLIQRAELVAQREELDQMYESGKQIFGRDFELFLKIREKQNQTSETSARYLLQEYEQQKALSFFIDVLNQIRQATKNKYQEKIDQLQWRIEQSGMSIDIENMEQLIFEMSSQVGLQLDKQMLHKKLQISSNEKDALFDKRESQLNDINIEIKKFEKLIKDNTNLVDNMILPQLKAMTTTFNEHKNKYKKLKQALFVLKERSKKAERELHELNQERTRIQQQQNVGSKVKKLESELRILTERLTVEQDEMNRLSENAEQIDREFRRAQQSLYLKEREIQHKLGNEANQSLGNTQQIASMNVKDIVGDERLRKRLQEVEEKIQKSMQERDDVSKKYNECFKLLNEAKESFEHAQQMMKSTQRIIESNSTISHSQTTSQRNLNTVSCESKKGHHQNQQKPNNRKHYISQNQLTFIKEQEMGSEMESEEASGYSHLKSQLSQNESRQLLNNFMSLQQSNHSSNRDLNSNLSSLKTLTQSQREKPFENNFYQRTKLSSIENLHGNMHERKTSKDKVKKIDLAKVYAMRDSQQKQANQQYSSDYASIGQQCNVQSASQKQMYNQSQKQLQRGAPQNFNSNNATTGTNLLQQELEAQGINDTTNILNLSDLVMNTSALQNLIHMSGLQDSRSQTQNSNNMLSPQDYSQQKPASYLTFNNTCNKQAFNNSDQIQQILITGDESPQNSQDKRIPFYYEQEQHWQQQKQSKKDIIVGSCKILSESSIKQGGLRESQFHNTQDDNSLFLIDSVGPHNNINNNSSCMVDSSLVQCLNEINGLTNQQQNFNYQQDIQDNNNKRPSTVLKRTSIETADFFQGNNNYQDPIIFRSNQQFQEFGRNEYDENNYLQRPAISHNKKVTANTTTATNNNSNNIRAYEINMSRVAPLQEHSICQDEYNLQQSQYDSNKLTSSLYDFQKQSRDNTYLSGQNLRTASNTKIQSNQGSRTENTNSKRKSESISPQPISRKNSNNRLKNKFWNRSTSVEKRYNSKINLSIGSIPSSINYMTIHNQSCYEQAPQQQRSNSRFGKKSHKLNKSVNNIDSSLMMRQSVNSSMLNPITMSMNMNNLSQFKNNNHQHSCNSNIDNELLQFTKIDVYFANRIKPLLEGTTFYKKFSSRQSLNENAFDPLQTDKFPPESCGYGIRWFQLDKTLTCINVRQSLKNAVETTIQINDIVKTIIPQTTRDIINAQKYKYHHHANHLRKSSRNQQLNSSSCANSTKDLLEEFLILDNVGGISSLAKIGIVNKNSDMYRQKCVDTTFYPFSLALNQGRIELIATSYEVLKIWVIGINLLVSNKKQVPKLKQLMNINLDY